MRKSIKLDVEVYRKLCQLKLALGEVKTTFSDFIADMITYVIEGEGLKLKVDNTSEQSQNQNINSTNESDENL